MSVLGIFDTANTALQVTRKALDTTAHNVANASTPGYTRQDVVLQNIPSGLITTTGSTGRGVRLTEVKRMYDSFVNTQLKNEKSNLAYWDTYQSGIIKVENIFNEAGDSGISPAITDFFNAWQDVSQSPEGFAQRTLLTKKADYLSKRINDAYSSLNEERNEIYKGSKTLVDEINTTTAKIADLNEKISGAPGSLDLMDQRDVLLERLNQIVKVTNFEDDAGRYTILLNGTPLVDGGKVFKMNVSTDADDKLVFSVEITNTYGAITEQRDVTDFITGGELSANIDLRDDKLIGYMDKLNTFAIGLTFNINQYNKAGYGLDGTTGNDFFYDIDPPFVTTDSESGGATVADSNVTISDLSNVDFGKQYNIDYLKDNAAYSTLSASDQATYQQDAVTGSYWRVRESTDGKTWTAINPANINIDNTVVNTRTLQFRGINVKIDGVIPAAGISSEEFNIKVNPNAATNMGVAITDVNKIAASLGDLNTQFTVKAGVNDTIVVNGGPITLGAGIYNRFELANELQSQMNTLLGANSVVVTFDAQNNKFSIKNNAPAAISVSWTDQSTTAEDLFGFNTASTIQPSGNAESNNEIRGGSVIVDTSNNSLKFSEDGGATYIAAVIPNGTYTREELAYVLQKAMEDADTSTTFTYTVTYNSAAKTYTITNDVGNANPNAVILDWTNQTTTAEGLFGFSSVSSMANGGSISSTSVVYPILPGDNRNAKIIADLINKRIFSEGSVSDFYRQMVSDVGVETSSAKQINSFQSTLVSQLETKREQLSGVSLDEEASNLIKYQKAFQAAAKMITIADDLLNTILSMTGR